MSVPVTIVVVTYTRRSALAVTLERLTALPERPPLIVVDNGSSDGTAGMVRERFPAVRLIALPANRGAAARTVGARAAATPYVAFCDDDCWWEEGSLARAAAILDGHPGVALVNARVLVGPSERLDSNSREMATSRFPRRTGGPWPAIGAFMAGAVVARRAAFLAAGGYHERYLIGAEESLLSLDLLDAGWELRYCDEIVLHHHPSADARDDAQRRRLVMRNLLWTAWLRCSPRAACAATLRLARRALADPQARAALADALHGARWVLRERRRIAPAVERLVLGNTRLFA